MFDNENFNMKSLVSGFLIVVAILIIGFNTYLYFSKTPAIVLDTESERSISDDVSVSYSENIGDTESVASVTGEVLEVTENIIRISTNGRDSYTGTITPSTTYYSGEEEGFLSNITENEVVTLFVSEKTEGVSDIISVRIIESFQDLDSQIPPSGAF